MNITWKEIAKEGWSFGRPPHNLSTDDLHFAIYRKEHADKFWTLVLKSGKAVEIQQGCHYTDGTYQSFTIYDGGCSNIEDFRTIIKLLGI